MPVCTLVQCAGTEIAHTAGDFPNLYAVYTTWLTQPGVYCSYDIAVADSDYFKIIWELNFPAGTAPDRVLVVSICNCNLPRLTYRVSIPDSYNVDSSLIELRPLFGTYVLFVQLLGTMRILVAFCGSRICLYIMRIKTEMWVVYCPDPTES